MPGGATCANCAIHWSVRSSCAQAQPSSPNICLPDSESWCRAFPCRKASSSSLGIGTTVDEAERLLIIKTLDHTHNNKTKAAEILGISLKTLHNKLKEYGQQSASGRGEPDAAAS